MIKFEKFNKGNYYEVPSIDGETFEVWNCSMNGGAFTVVRKGDKQLCLTRINTLYQANRRSIELETVVEFIFTHPHKFNNFFEQTAECRSGAGPWEYWGRVESKCA